MRDFIIVVSTIGAIAAVICWTRWRTGSIYQDTQEQLSMNLEE